MRRTVTCLLVCLIAAFESLGAGARGGLVTPFDTSPHGGVVVNVALDGRGPFRMIVDTGSTHSVITARVAAAVGGKAVAQAEVSTTAGSQMLPVTSVGCLRLGPIAVPVLPTVVDDLPVAGEADGLIGLDVLADRHFTIDYGRRRIIWHDPDEPAPPGGPASVDLHMFEGRLVVDAFVDGGAMPLVVDSASETLVLFGIPSPRARPGTPAHLDTLVDHVPVQVGAVVSLRIGSAEQRDIRAAHVGPRPTSGRPAGLVPTHGFSRVTIDGPRRRLTVWK